MITIESLRVNYKDFVALDIQQPLQINPQDRIGVIGSNGAGKSTLIKALLGLVPYQGQVKTGLSPTEMAVHMQQNEYVETLSTKSIIEAILNTRISLNPRLQELIEFFDFTGCLKKKYKQLSGGQKQRFTLILVLMQDAPVTFFDEVTTGLDFETRQALMAKITTWYQDKPSALFFVTHYYEELENLTNRLLILDHGKVVDFGNRDDLFKKYCGHSVIIFKTDDITPLQGFNFIQAPPQSYAISCQDKEEEMAIIQVLNQHALNFKRSNKDIEVLVLNAIKGELA